MNDTVPTNKYTAEEAVLDPTAAHKMVIAFTTQNAGTSQNISGFRVKHFKYATDSLSSVHF